DVPFAFLAIGVADQLLDGHPRLSSRPRIHRPYHSPTLHAATCSLYSDSLARKIVRGDRLIGEGKARLAKQIALNGRLAARGHDTSTADALAREYGRTLKAMRDGRELLLCRQGAFSKQAMGVAEHDPHGSPFPS